VVFENAEAIRREGVEAFENSREMKIRLELEAEKRSGAAPATTDRSELEALKDELHERAERESRELRDALDAERARLYQDLEAERRAHEALPPPESPEAAAGAEALEGADDRLRRLHAESGEHREGIAREVRQYLSPGPKAASVTGDARPETPDPSRREPWQTRDEMKFLLWISVGVGLVAAVVACALFFQG
jgi:hypothetical protein